MNKLKLYFFLPLLLLVGVACEDEDKNPVPLPPNGAMILIDEVVSALFDLDDISNSRYEAVIRDVANNVASYDILVQVSRQNGRFVSDVSFVKSVTNFSSNLVITPAEVAAAVDTLKLTEDADEDDIPDYNPNDPTTYILLGDENEYEGGDRINFINEIVGVNGVRYFATDQSPDLAGDPGQRSGFRITIFAACPSDEGAIVGDYTSEVIASNFAGFIGSTNDDVIVEKVGVEPFRYQVSDHTALAYEPFGGTEYEGDFFDICGTTFLQPTRSFGNVVDNGPGTIDLVNNTFTLLWFETFNGLTGEVLFTKK
ncbi:MAG: hypothetical protein HC913_13865 [Microscillaceae bacterium]|nr:hypothetical protein [Microscillaceae bacterium]